MSVHIGDDEDDLTRADCEFCHELRAGQAADYKRIFGLDESGRVIATTEHFALVVDLSPVDEGHLLVLPIAHFLSMARAIERHRAEFEAFIALVQELYRAAFGDQTIIEHGSTAGEPKNTSCIEHAHWHLLPFGPELLEIVRSDLPSSPRRLEELTDLTVADGDRAYIFAAHGDERLLFEMDRLPNRQYARSVAGRALGLADPAQWDWGVNPRPERLARSLGRARSALAALAAKGGLGGE